MIGARARPRSHDPRRRFDVLRAASGCSVLKALQHAALALTDFSDPGHRQYLARHQRMISVRRNVQGPGSKGPGLRLSEGWVNTVKMIAEYLENALHFEKMSAEA